MNPTQFNDPRDLEKYPRTLEKDLELLRQSGVDAVFVPRAEEIYSDRFRFKISENQESLGLCGASRPGHFDGVLTVVMKFLQIVQPSRAYFGEKDFQQLKLIQGLVETFFLDTEIVACPTVREDDGLAMSSRNLRLTPEQRAQAPKFYSILKDTNLDIFQVRQKLQEAGFKVDYVEDLWNRRLAAVFLGEIRLIDNVEFHSRQKSTEPKSPRSALITAGATREPIDGIRFISNVSTGQTGAELADFFVAAGWKVTYLHGIGALKPKNPTQELCFSSFQDLELKLRTELSRENFDLVVHCAAVSDFSVAGIERGEKFDDMSLSTPDLNRKMSSQGDLRIELKQNPKLLPKLKSQSRNPSLKVVGFKLTLNSSENEQLELARGLLGESVDAVVANDWTVVNKDRRAHSGCLVIQDGKEKPFQDLNELAIHLQQLIAEDVK